MGYGIKSMNFKKPTLSDQLPDFLKLDMSLGKKEKDGSKPKVKINMSLKGKFDATERWLLRGILGIFMLIIIYSGISIYLENSINEKIADAEESINYTQRQIDAVASDITQLNQVSNRYVDMTNNLRDINDKIQTDLSLKGSIPNLLTEIMSVIPNQVQITEIQNTTDNEARHVIINAQSKYYDELGYFKAKLKEDNVLTNIVSTQGEKQGDFVKIVIEGDLP